MIVTMRDIEKAVSLKFNLPLEELRSIKRDRYIARPRQIAMFLSREMTQNSLPRIGRHFGRDHTTVLHAIRAVNRLSTSPDFAAQVEGCREIVAKSDRWKEAVRAAMQMEAA